MKNIILIDDDLILRQTLSARLRDAGYAVLEAANGAEAVQLLRAQPVDLVVTDMLMPEMEGVETIRAIRHYHPTVKIVAISGGGTNFGDSYLKLAMQLGAHTILSKPFGAQELIAAVDGLLAS